MIQYKIVDNGTSLDKMMLWAPRAPLIEIQCGERPAIMIVAEEGVGEVIELAFDQCPAVPVIWPELYKRDPSLEVEHFGWTVSAQDNGRWLCLTCPNGRQNYRLHFQDDHVVIRFESPSENKSRFVRMDRKRLCMSDVTVQFETPKHPQMDLPIAV